MVDPSQTRDAWVDLGGIQRLADRAARTAVAPQEAQWRDGPRPVLGRHWPLADHDWHRRRSWWLGEQEHAETDHHFTRYALLPDGRLVRADAWGSEIEGADAPDAPWSGEVRPITTRDVHLLDQRVVPFSTERGTTRTWGARPSGDPDRPWPGAGAEVLLKALIP